MSQGTISFSVPDLERLHAILGRLDTFHRLIWLLGTLDPQDIPPDVFSLLAHHHNRDTNELIALFPLDPIWQQRDENAEATP